MTVDRRLLTEKETRKLKELRFAVGRLPSFFFQF